MGEKIMPYIVDEKREQIDLLVDNLIDKLDTMGITGNLNYVLFRMAKNLCHDYATHSAFIADLECAKLEIYRRLTVPYEETKIIENGDVL